MTQQWLPVGRNLAEIGYQLLWDEKMLLGQVADPRVANCRDFFFDKPDIMGLLTFASVGGKK